MSRRKLGEKGRGREREADIQNKFVFTTAQPSTRIILSIPRLAALSLSTFPLASPSRLSRRGSLKLCQRRALCFVRPAHRYHRPLLFPFPPSATLFVLPPVPNSTCSDPRVATAAMAAGVTATGVEKPRSSNPLGLLSLFEANRRSRFFPIHARS